MEINKFTSIGTNVILKTKSRVGIAGVIVGYDNSNGVDAYFVKVDSIVDEEVFVDATNTLTLTPLCRTIEEMEYYFDDVVLSLKLFSHSSKYLWVQSSALYATEDLEDIQKEKEVIDNLGKIVGLKCTDGRTINAKVIAVDTDDIEGQPYLCGIEGEATDADLYVYGYSDGLEEGSVNAPVWEPDSNISQLLNVDYYITLSPDEMDKYKQFIYVEMDSFVEPAGKSILEFMKPEYIDKVIGCTYDKSFKYVIVQDRGTLQLMDMTNGHLVPVTFNSTILKWEFYLMEDRVN